MQLLEETLNIQIWTLSFKQISSGKIGKQELFCKIIMGDSSDNISSVLKKCGPKTAIKYFENRELLEKKLQESETYRTTYELNKKIIDFNNIPEELVEEFMNNKIQ